MKDSVSKYLYRYLLAAAIFAVVSGTVVFHFLEHLSWLNAYYFSVVTLATVGYGDITPHTPAGKIFATIYIMFGIGIITSFFTLRTQRRSQKIAERREEKSKKRG